MLYPIFNPVVLITKNIAKTSAYETPCFDPVVLPSVRLA